MPRQSKPALPRSISQSSLAIKARLQEKLITDMKKPDEQGDKVHYLDKFSVYTFRLPSMKRRSPEFMRYFMNLVLDNNIDFDLCNAKIINWWTPFLKKLFPLSTMGDGNCLLHAVSQAMWGCHDHSHFLRRLMYVVLASDVPDEFRVRWQREQKNQDMCERRLEITMTSMQWQRQWEDILKSAEDRVQTTNVNASALECLEGIHIFVLVNILRRPIIVLSETVQNDFEGQAIGYNHLGGIYLPLLWKPVDCVRTPIVLAYHCNHFVPMLSMMDPPDVVVTETGKHGVPLVSSNLEQLPLHYLKEGEERESANLLTLYLDVFETNMMIQGGSLPVLYAKFHFNDIDREFNMLDEYMNTIDHIFLIEQGAGQTNIFPSWNNRDELGGSPLEPTAPSASLLTDLSLMSIHTVPQPDQPPSEVRPATARPLEQRNAPTENPFFPPQRGVASYPPRQIQTPMAQVNATSTYPPRRQSPEYRDVSISGEECRNPNCSFYSSLETYPYCHECKAKLMKMQSSQRLPGVTEEEERVRSRREGLSASRLRSTGSNDEVFGNQSFRSPDRVDRQRSISYEEEEHHDLQHERDEQPFSIPYTANRVSCSQPNCPKRGKNICEGRCHEHYRCIGHQDLHMLRSGENRSTRSHLDHVPVVPIRTEREGERQARANVESKRMTASAFEMRSTGSESPRTRRSGAQEPGTRSLDDANTQAFATYPPTSPARIGQSVGRIPGGLLEPTSMRSPVVCKNPTCNKQGYEYTEGFCQTCFNAISIATAGRARKPRQLEFGFPPTPRLPCRTANCMIYAQPDMDGYCNLCFRKLFDVDEPHSLSSSVSEPTRPNPPQIMPINLPLPMAEKCIVPGCDRYGDPAYQGSCKRCLDLQRQTRLAGLGLQQSPERQAAARNPIAGPATTSSEVDIAYERNEKEIIEKASKKATGSCKNTRCQNFGNLSCRGYCNSCYQSMRQ